MKKYILTEEHRAQIPAWRDKWIANAMSTRPMTDEDREATRVSILGLYRAAGLPLPKAIVFVPSPFVLRFAGGEAAWWWWCRRDNAATRDATRAATDAATSAATDAATLVATFAATSDAIDAATSDATFAATSDATDYATDSATRAATRDATLVATSAATSAATDSATRAATDAATLVATFAATSDATDAATSDATFAATFAATDYATDSATRDATLVATSSATSAATDSATRAATDAATSAETDYATLVATFDATDSATRVATLGATSDATFDATRAATRGATSDATFDATRAATDYATDSATDSATSDATLAATRESEWYVCSRPHLSAGGWMCAKEAWRMWQGGNQWSSYDSFLSFFDRVVGLDLLEYEAWRHWEQASLHSGPRIMHADFCMVSDRPDTLLVDDRNRPHCTTGPFCRWRDGSALYAVHGVRVPAWIIERPESITCASIDSERNAEIRRVMIEQCGISRYLKDSGATKVNESSRGKLWRKEVIDDEPIQMVEVLNSTPEPGGERKTYFLRVPPDVRTADDAVAWTFGIEPGEYNPVVET